MIASGEIINTIAYFSIILVYLLIKAVGDIRNSRRYLIYITILISAGGLFVALDQALLNRIIFSLSNRMPWQENSDYYIPLKAGFEFAKDNLLLGIGPKNTFFYCENVVNSGEFDIIKILGVNKCPWHPHNMYIQVAAETGLIGLALFSLVVFYLVFKGFSDLVQSSYINIIPFAIILVNFFPLQTYSQAFGQSRNFYLWTVIAYAMSRFQQGTKPKWESA
jgi:O-antigen ligase